MTSMAFSCEEWARERGCWQLQLGGQRPHPGGGCLPGEVHKKSVAILTKWESGSSVSGVAGRMAKELQHRGRAARSSLNHLRLSEVVQGELLECGVDMQCGC